MQVKGTPFILRTVETMKIPSPQEPWTPPEGVEVNGPIPMVGPLEFRLDGRTVVGRIIHRSSRDLCVQMVEPPTIKAWRHIAYFAAQHMSYLGERGDTSALHLMAQLARAEWNKKAIIDRLLGSYRDMRRAEAEIPVPELYGEAELHEWRRVQRKAIRNGTSDPRVFEMELSRHRRAHREYERAKDHCRAAFENLIPEDLLGQREQVVSWLEAEMHRRS